MWRAEFAKCPDVFHTRVSLLLSVCPAQSALEHSSTYISKCPVPGGFHSAPPPLELSMYALLAWLELSMCALLAWPELSMCALLAWPELSMCALGWDGMSLGKWGK